MREVRASLASWRWHLLSWVWPHHFKGHEGKRRSSE
jgi:hypothetical protein